MEEISERMDHFLALRWSRWKGAADVWLLHHAVGSGTVEGWICSSILYFVGGWREARRDRAGRKEDH